MNPNTIKRVFELTLSVQNLLMSLCLCLSISLELLVNSNTVVEVSQLCLTLWPNGLYSPWNSLGQNTGVEAFPFSSEYSQPRDLTQVCHIAGGIFCQLSRRARLRTLEWAAYPFSRESSRFRNWTRVSCITGGFFTNWTIREAQRILTAVQNGFTYLPSCQHYRTTHVLTRLSCTLENFVSHLS